MSGPQLVRHRRLAVVLAGAGVLLAAPPCFADRADDDEAAALEVLETAAAAGRTATYSGTKFVAAWRETGTVSSLVDVRHDPRRGLQLSPSGAVAGDADEEALVVAATRVDLSLLGVLADGYRLHLAPPGRCTGREAHVVEALREDDSVAGRFWVDRESGVLLRREVYDPQGRRLRSSAFVDLTMEAPAVSGRPVAAAAGALVPRSRLQDVRDDGWPVPDRLPGGFALFEARQDDDGVLHLSYSDGLSTTSLFVQRGSPGAAPPDGFVRRTLGSRAVWVHEGAPARVVWAGEERVWTLVSDAPDAAVQDAVGALPHDPVPEEGWRARLSRGLQRLGSWLNPFD